MIKFKPKNDFFSEFFGIVNYLTTHTSIDKAFSEKKNFSSELHWTPINVTGSSSGTILKQAGNKAVKNRCGQNTTGA